ncbi:2-oxoglutarate dehydrogenase E2 component [Marininema mesophilum]|uniref:Dihydrolipoyllysine-residue succinyltransferase component of 2-oxoglutarate dehydrogenase complex n=1 Tax=Marininema mesophilum TaxID=1048340 RepID=A0A1H2XZI4_9BACL|nr:2-oxoglutarate dehydrogenase complex dihydrolipoyllysine-residue succinyltransferase [Marininema mesophilum]SDW98266.1 2-oxoglutarate dehydrogenase E2 component [Marininema mesophilum]
MKEIKVPELAESITEGTIANWMKAAGDSVEEGEILLELETDKVNLEINAEESGVLKEIVKQEGDTVEVGETIAILDVGGQASEKKEEPKEEKKEEVKKEESDSKKEPKEETSSDTEEESHSSRIASPAVRKLAREKGIDLDEVRTADPSGRITVEDVNNYREGKEAAPAKKAEQPKAATDPKTEENGRPAERVRMTRRRQTIANRLVQAQHEAAMLTTFNEVDLTRVMEIRKRRKEAFKEQHEVNLGFMSFFAKAATAALKAYPRLNAEIQGQEMLLKKYYDIGIAVSAQEGLVVPVVRDADKLSFGEIEKEIVRLAGKARNNTLTLDELQGGSFTITNGGVFGSLLSTPILNAPQVGILGMHKIQQRPITLEDGSIESRPMMYLALSYDHRIVDGAEAVSFLVKIKQLLEDPELLMLEG